MSKNYVLFTEEELDDLRDGRKIEYTNGYGDTIYFMSKEHYEQMNAISKDEWDKAYSYLKDLIVEYACLGGPGTYALNAVLVPLRKRYDSGERTRELYDEIMRCE